MAGLNFLKASAGAGNAVLAHVQSNRTIGATVLDVDSVANWPSEFIATVGTLLGTGFLNPATVTEFRGHLNSGDIIIDGYEPGHTDTGNVINQVVIIKQTTGWADSIINAIRSSHNDDGSLKTSAVQTALNIGNTPAAGWNPLGFTFSYGANAGAKEFTITAPGDLSTTLSPGMRMQVTRNTVPPTQSLGLVAASSQYATKASPTGISFTGVFTVEAWVYVPAYSGQDAVIMSRYDNTNGWIMNLSAVGQISLQYFSGGAQTRFLTWRSVPTGRWVHIAGVVTSVGSKTAAIYINGESVPFNTTATAASAVNQGTGPLQIGAYNSLAGSYFNGYISEARLWNAAQSQAQVQANMGINLVGSETNLIGLWKGNGVFTDATTNANTLTATNGAVATQAANPFNLVEYAIIHKVSYVNPTTTITLFAGTDCTIPNMTLTNPQYSNVKSPYGFPASKNKWVHEALWIMDVLNANVTTLVNSPSNAVWYNNANFDFNIPLGDWDILDKIPLFGLRSGAGSTSMFSTISSTTNTETIPQTTASDHGGTVTGGGTTHTSNGPASVAAQAAYHILVATVDAMNSINVVNGGRMSIRCTSAYV